jgi:hypothetical protein
MNEQLAFDFDSLEHIETVSKNFIKITVDSKKKVVYVERLKGLIDIHELAHCVDRLLTSRSLLTSGYSVHLQENIVLCGYKRIDVYNGQE